MLEARVTGHHNNNNHDRHRSNDYNPTMHTKMVLHRVAEQIGVLRQKLWQMRRQWLQRPPWRKTRLLRVDDQGC